MDKKQLEIEAAKIASEAAQDYGCAEGLGEFKTWLKWKIVTLAEKFAKGGNE